MKGKSKRRSGKKTSALSQHPNEAPVESQPSTRGDNAGPSLSLPHLQQTNQPNAAEDASVIQPECEPFQLQVRTLRKRKLGQKGEPSSSANALAPRLDNKRHHAETPSNLFRLLPKDVLVKIINMLDDAAQVFTFCKTCKDLYDEYWNRSDVLDRYQFRIMVPLVAPGLNGRVERCVPLRRSAQDLAQLVALYVTNDPKNTAEFMICDVFRRTIQRVEIAQSNSSAFHSHAVKPTFSLRNQDRWAVFVCQTCVFHINNVSTGQLLCMLTVKASEIRSLRAPYMNEIDHFFISDDCKCAVANIGDWPLQRLVIWNLEELHKPRRYPSRNPVVISGTCYTPYAPHAFDFDDLRFDRENRYILAVRDEVMEINHNFSRRYGSFAVFDIKQGRVITELPLFTNIPVDDKRTFYTRILRFSENAFALALQRDVTVIVQKWELSLGRVGLVSEFCLSDLMMDIDQEEDIFMWFANDYDNLRPLNLEHRQLVQLRPRVVSWDKVLDGDFWFAETIDQVLTKKPTPVSGNGFKSLVVDPLNVLGHAASDMSSLITMVGEAGAVMWYNLLK